MTAPGFLPHVAAFSRTPSSRTLSPAQLILSVWKVRTKTTTKTTTHRKKHNNHTTTHCTTHSTSFICSRSQRQPGHFSPFEFRHFWRSCVTVLALHLGVPYCVVVRDTVLLSELAWNTRPWRSQPRKYATRRVLDVPVMAIQDKIAYHTSCTTRSQRSPGACRENLAHTASREVMNHLESRDCLLLCDLAGPTERMTRSMRSVGPAKSHKRRQSATLLPSSEKEEPRHRDIPTSIPNPQSIDWRNRHASQKSCRCCVFFFL